MASAAPVVLGRHAASSAPTLRRPTGVLLAPQYGGTRRKETPSRRWFRRVVSLVLSVVLTFMVAVFLFLGVGPHLLGYRTQTMLTGSMEPGIMVGDVVVTVAKPVSEVKVGDVISYHIPVEDHRVETHRVIEVISGDDGRIAVRTRGDNNPTDDPWIAVLDGDQVWEMKYVVPELGTLVRLVRTPVLLQGALYGGLALLLVVGMSTIWSKDETGREQQ